MLTLLFMSESELDRNLDGALGIIGRAIGRHRRDSNETC